MREAAPAVFPVFRSRLTAAVLARTYIGEGEYSIAELARVAGTDTGTMAREIKRLETAGVVRVLEDVGGGLVDGNRTGAGSGVGFLSGMHGKCREMLLLSFCHLHSPENSCGKRKARSLDRGPKENLVW